VSSPVGCLVYASNAQRHIVNTAWRDFGPCLGIAYQLREKLVLRTGYGLFYNPTTFGTQGAGVTGNEGFQAVTSPIYTMNNDGSTPWGRVSDPYPTGLLYPTGSSLGGATNLGLGVTEPLRNQNIPPYTQTWSGGLQYELRGGWLIDANYLGTKGTHLYFYGSGSLTTLGPWVEKEATNPALVTALSTYVTNPYYGVINTTGCGICSPTIQAGHLMQPFPQFSGASETDLAVANSIYNAFQLKIEKRMSHGLSVLASYTNSKSIDDASVSTSTTWIGGFQSLRDPNNLKEERSLSE